MPIGLYTQLRGQRALRPVLAAKGSSGCSTCPDTFLNPDRMNAGLMWFTRGFVEYQFPNNARLVGKRVAALEFSMELSSEVPGTSADWPSDITVAVNGREIGMWTSPGDFGDQRGVFTPDWWKLKGSQYGKLKSWRVTPEGSFVDGVRIVAADARRPRHLRPSLDPAQDRGQAGRPPSGRRQRLRPRLRQLRSGHRAAADHRLVEHARPSPRAALISVRAVLL